MSRKTVSTTSSSETLGPLTGVRKATSESQQSTAQAFAASKRSQSMLIRLEYPIKFEENIIFTKIIDRLNF